MKNTNFQSLNPNGNGKGKDKESEAQKLFNALLNKPLSRRMVATEIGYPDQTYMVTQIIYDWLEAGRAQVIGKIKCERSGRMVEAISTNPNLFKKQSNQLNLF